MRRVGVDVGGTNTDAVVVDDGVVTASFKAPTSDDVLGGVAAALAGIPLDGVAAVIVGTTQFTNAVVQRRGLNPVGFVRIGLPAGSTLGPLVDWPTDLAAQVRGEVVHVAGGFEYDGRPFQPLDEDGVAAAARRFADLGIDAVVVTGAFSPVDASQEERAGEILAAELGDASITLSHRLGRLGLLERENAAGLNASLVHLARGTVEALARSLASARLGDGVRLFLTQNDGTLLALEEAVRYPVLTFASGPTNSMRGAALLAGLSDSLVVDVGGTTADFGALVAGYPRQANAAVEVGGVRTLFRLPDLFSIGLGGGSVLRGGPLRLGPDSVGQNLLARALSLGGDTATLSDAAVAVGLLSLPGARSVELPASAEDAMALAAAMIGAGADRMKLSAAPVPLVAVGGGAFAVPDTLPGIGEVIRPRHAEVANAVGAALAEVSGEVDRVFRGMGRDEALAEAVRLATERAVASGAVPATTSVVDIEDLPLAYLAGDARRVRARVIGRLAG